MKDVTIVCDGSSLGNGRGVTRAAAVAVLGFKGFWKAVGEYLGNATNQQAEIHSRTPLRSLPETTSTTFRLRQTRCSVRSAATRNAR